MKKSKVLVIFAGKIYQKSDESKHFNLIYLRGKAELLWWWDVCHISTDIGYFNIYTHCFDCLFVILNLSLNDVKISSITLIKIKIRDFRGTFQLINKINTAEERK